MEADLSKLTGSLTIRGIVAVLFGIAAVFWPGLTLVTLVYLFSTFILISGLVDIIFGIVNVSNEKQSVLTRILKLALGVVELGVGVYLLRHVHVTFSVLILLIGFTLIIRGVFELVEGLLGEGTGGYRILTAIVGLLAVLVGIIVLFQPVASGVAFVWLLGIYGLIVGPLSIAGAVEAHNMSKKLSANSRK